MNKTAVSLSVAVLQSRGQGMIEQLYPSQIINFKEARTNQEWCVARNSARQHRIVGAEALPRGSDPSVALIPTPCIVAARSGRRPWRGRENPYVAYCTRNDRWHASPGLRVRKSWNYYLVALRGLPMTCNCARRGGSRAPPPRGSLPRSADTCRGR